MRCWKVFLNERNYIRGGKGERGKERDKERIKERETDLLSIRFFRSYIAYNQTLKPFDSHTLKQFLKTQPFSSSQRLSR